MSEFASRFGGHERVTFVHLKSPLAFEDIGHGFDLIQLNAVFEHLLPAERKEVMPLLWRRLAVDGYLVLTETPWRWFPVETHTTSLPFVNYMPDRLALMAARHCGRYPKTLTWEEALRAGLRGATVGEIMASLECGDGTAPRLVRGMVVSPGSISSCRKRRAAEAQTNGWVWAGAPPKRVRAAARSRQRPTHPSPAPPPRHVPRRWRWAPAEAAEPLPASPAPRCRCRGRRARSARRRGPPRASCSPARS